MSKKFLGFLFVLLASNQSFAQVTMDIIIGNSDGICYAYRNMGTPAAPVWVAMPAWNVPDAGSDTAPCYGDLDNDGDWDLLVGEDLGECYAYENIGSISAPVWSARPDWNIPNFSSDARPMLADMDKDCDFDAYVGENFGGSYYYENTGTPFAPSWNDHAPWDLPDIGDDTRPLILDLDGDGDYDALIGEDDGVCYGYENIGSDTSPIWSAQPAWNTPDVGTEAAPTYGDLDGDGDFDLIVGNIAGSNLAIENTGTSAIPTWAFRPAWDAPSVSGEAEPLLLDLDDAGNTNALCLSLPVELLHFRAKQKESVVLLQWQTAAEVNNDYFEVQHAVDAVNWSVIGQMDGMGNSSIGKHYEYTHTNPSAGNNYYRLKQVDYDGAFEYSSIDMVSYQSQNMFNLYPNPVKNKLTIQWTTDGFDDLQVEVFDLTSRLVLEEEFNGKIGLNTSKLQLENLNSGVYFIRLSSGNELLFLSQLIKK